MIISIIVGCKKENELKKSVWIPDSDYNDLPAYTEWGYNTFGAYYDRQAFVSNNNAVPAKVIFTNNNTSFELYGQLNNLNYDEPDKKMIMKFRLPNIKPTQYKDLIALNGVVLDLTDSLTQVTIINDTTENIVKILSGELKFKRVQNLIVDKKPIEVILSGYFDFRTLINNQPITIWEGRFDVGVGPDNFYIY